MVPGVSIRAVALVMGCWSKDTRGLVGDKYVGGVKIDGPGKRKAESFKREKITGA